MKLKAEPLVNGKVYRVVRGNEILIYTKKELIEIEHQSWWKNVKLWLKAL